MQRIESIDILKGFGIILMIVAHTYGPNSTTWDFIYTFHMPLFFIVTGFFYEQNKITELLDKSFKQLILPFIAICVIVLTLGQIRQPHSIISDIRNASYGIGPTWFLLAMFMARLEFHYILKLFPNRYCIVSTIISLCVCLLYQDLFSFLSLFPSLASLFFISVGYYIKEHHLQEFINKHSVSFISIGLLLWLFTSLYGKVELSRCLFKLSIVDFAGSLGGTLVFFIISIIIAKRTIILRNILSKAGRYSLIIMFFHCIDYCIPIWYILIPYLPSSILLTSILILRLVYVTICVVFTLRIKWLRYFFRVH